MSHFIMLAVVDDESELDEILAPYCEDPPTDSPYWKKEIICKNTKQALLQQIKKYQKNNPTDERKDVIDRNDKNEMWEYIKQYEGCESDVEGNLYYMYNPDSKWDWWTIYKLLRNHSGEIVSSIVKRDVNWEYMIAKAAQDARKDYTSQLKYWQLIEQEEYPTLDQYVEQQSDLDYIRLAWGIVDKKGWWDRETFEKEKGYHIAWKEEDKAFQEEFKKKFESIPDDKKIYYINCHI